jgi:hypothetical protein
MGLKRETLERYLLTRRARAGVSLISVLVLAACGSSTSGDVSVGGQTDPASAPPTIDTVIPSGEGMEFPMKTFEGMTEVATDAFPSPSKLPYAVTFPSSAGAPMGVWVSNPDAYAPGDSEVVLEYDASSPYGAFRIRERQPPPGMHSPTFIQDIPKYCTTCTDARLVDLGPSLQGALLAGAPGATSVTWLQGDYEVVVIGPPTFTVDQAISLARETAAGISKAS